MTETPRRSKRQKTAHSPPPEDSMMYDTMEHEEDSSQESRRSTRLSSNAAAGANSNLKLKVKPSLTKPQPEPELPPRSVEPPRQDAGSRTLTIKIKLNGSNKSAAYKKEDEADDFIEEPETQRPAKRVKHEKRPSKAGLPSGTTNTPTGSELRKSKSSGLHYPQGGQQFPGNSAQAPYSSPPRSQAAAAPPTPSGRSVKKTRKRGVARAPEPETPRPRTKRERKEVADVEQDQHIYHGENEYNPAVAPEGEPEAPTEAENTDGAAEEVTGTYRGRPKTRASTRKKRDDKRGSTAGGSSTARTNEAVAAEIAAEEAEEGKEAYTTNFWTSVAPYFAPFNSNDLDFCYVEKILPGIPDTSPVLEIPPLGTHYKEIWYQQDQAEDGGVDAEADMMTTEDSLMNIQPED